MSYRVATIDGLQDIAYRQDTHMRPVRHHLGITAFGTNAWTAIDEGDRPVPEHREDEGKEELYVVLRGRARFEIDGDAVDAPVGRLAFVGPEGNRTAFAEEAGTTVLAIGNTAGRPFEVGGWEVMGGVLSCIRGRRLRAGDRPRSQHA
jgi:mannose-6-phosphate isomerase-like protein (cupin superfamily)